MNPVIDIAIRSSAVLLLAIVTVRLLRNQSAARRHLVLAVAVVAAITVAPLVWLGAGWTWSVPAAPSAVFIEAPTDGAPPAAEEYGESLAGSPSRDWLVMVWLGGAMFAGTRLLWRLVRLRSLTRSAARLDGAWANLLAAAAETMGVRQRVSVHATDDERVTGNWGWRRPAILVPADASDWSETRVRLVLFHEVAHVRRGDWLVQMGGEILRALYWFNPLAALVVAGVRREAERACDDLVLRAGIPAHVYGAELVAIARLQSSPRATPLVSMAHPTTLEGRIAAMLDPTLDHRPSTRRVAAFLVAVALAVAAPIAALRVVAQEARALAIQVFDPSGGVLPGVGVEIDSGQDGKRSAMTDGTGRVVFPDIADGDYTMKASVAGFRTLSATLAVRDPRDRQRSITLQVGELQETVSVRERRRAAAATPSVASTDAVRVGGNIKAPKKLTHVSPEYPPAMLDAGLEGVVPMEALIARDGSVVSVRVLSADVHPEFARAAEVAVRQWQFSPTLLNGEAVDVRMAVSIRFSLQD
jgi:TonB family protein